jgi:hypothetical protein
MLGEVIIALQVAVVLTIIATALFGSETLSERAFRLWFGNCPEPPAPRGKLAERGRDTDLLSR